MYFEFLTIACYEPYYVNELVAFDKMFQSTTSPEHLDAEVPIASMEDFRLNAGCDQSSEHGQLTVKSPVLCATVGTTIYPSEPDLKTALECFPSNDFSPFFADFGECFRRWKPESVIHIPEERRSVGRPSSIRITEEESDDFGGGEEAQIRSIHNDGHFHNHRLSKLSIHTNNDEFFYVGGHPPSDGRTSLRSCGTTSRQSILRSSEFLSGTCDEELTKDSFEAALSPQSPDSNLHDAGDLDTADDIFEDAPQSARSFHQEEIPTILLNGKRMSCTSN
ncbi:hypothetical protein GCK32_013905, partial [Trichostrongylus colubriformis]